MHATRLTDGVYCGWEKYCYGFEVLHFDIPPACEESTCEPRPSLNAAPAILLSEGEEPGVKLVIFMNNIVH